MRQLIIVAIIWCMLPSISLATSLGRLTVKSTIGQPLQASILVVSPEKSAQQHATVNVVPTHYQDTIAVEQQPILRDLTLTTAKEANGALYIHIRSQKPINIPFLRLPIQITWPNGQLQREYMVFLDQPHEQVATQQIRPITKPPQVNIKQHLYGPTRANDRLWQIANAYHQTGSKTSIQQLMLAIFLANPRAFTNNNMNHLKQGQYLHIPSLHAAAAYSQQQALAAIAQSANKSAT